MKEYKYIKIEYELVKGCNCENLVIDYEDKISQTGGKYCCIHKGSCKNADSHCWTKKVPTK